MIQNYLSWIDDNPWRFIALMGIGYIARDIYKTIRGIR